MLLFIEMNKKALKIPQGQLTENIVYQWKIMQKGGEPFIRVKNIVLESYSNYSAIQIVYEEIYKCSSLVINDKDLSFEKANQVNILDSFVELIMYSIEKNVSNVEDYGHIESIIRESLYFIQKMVKNSISNNLEYFIYYIINSIRYLVLIEMEELQSSKKSSRLIEYGISSLGLISSILLACGKMRE